jgi:hypothetical protein
MLSAQRSIAHILFICTLIDQLEELASFSARGMRVLEIIEKIIFKTVGGPASNGSNDIFAFPTIGTLKACRSHSPSR